MKRKKKRIIIITVLIAVFIVAVFGYNQYELKKEEAYIDPLGNMVSVNDHNISIYTKGEGPKTLVFLSGGGTCSPILDFRTLYKKLENSYKIVVIEKLGYGFSDSGKDSRDIDTLLSELRGALSAMNITGPYILCPHSLGGIEAIYWSQMYPKEVEAVIGLDMATPYHYEKYKSHTPLLLLSKAFIKVGAARLIPFIWKGDAVKNKNLTNEEEKIYKALFFKSSLSYPMINEARSAKSNAAYVKSKGFPQIPLLMFVSNGKGTGIKKDVWIDASKRFVKEVQNGEIITLDCPHYVHDYEADKIYEEMKIFIDAL